MITTKENMCETAIQLFREQGYENVSVNTICNRLQVTRGSFYHHFESKTDLLLYWFSSQAKRHIVLNPDEGYPKLVLKKHALDYAHLIHNVGHDFMYHILMAEFELQGKHFHTYFEAEGKTIELIQQAMDMKEIQSAKDAKQLLDTFSAAVIGAIVLWKLEKGGFDIVQKIDTVFDITYR